MIEVEPLEFTIPWCCQVDLCSVVMLARALGVAVPRASTSLCVRWASTRPAPVQQVSQHWGRTQLKYPLHKLPPAPTPSGFRPPHGGTENLPFKIHRTAGQQLPVYIGTLDVFSRLRRVPISACPRPCPSSFAFHCLRTLLSIRPLRYSGTSPSLPFRFPFLEEITESRASLIGSHCSLFRHQEWRQLYRDDCPQI